MRYKIGLQKLHPVVLAAWQSEIGSMITPRLSSCLGCDSAALTAYNWTAWIHLVPSRSAATVEH